MKFKNATLLFIGFLALIILFDVFQQHYYLNNFNILEEGIHISVSSLIASHFLRWLIWSISCLPLSWFSWKVFTNKSFKVSNSNWLKIITIAIFSWLTALALISIFNIYSGGFSFTLSLLLENYLFFIAQKGISFLFAYSILILTLFNNAKNRVIEAQWIELSNLKDTQTTEAEYEKDPQINIKIGNRVKIIPLTEVTWVEADDYCVKIHTQQKSYSLRQSLKSMEEQLSPYQFLRVHRGALLNLGYLDQVDYEQSVIKLQDASELPLSKAGAKVLRKVLKANSI